MYLVEYDETYTGGDYHSVGTTVRIACTSDDAAPAAFKGQTGVDPIHIVHYRRAEEVEEDLPAKRAGTPHAEDVIGGRSRCGICGWVDEADPKDPTVRAWHGDSFTEEVLQAAAAGDGSPTPT